MATVNDQIDIEPHAIKWAIDAMKGKTLTVDNSFQRNYVWLVKHQIKLMETILMGFPIPEIYLWQKDTDGDTGTMQLSIIDGQQRLGAIMDFLNDGYSLNPLFLNKENFQSDFANKKFSELNGDLKSSIWKFKLSIRFVKDTVLRDDVVKMFLRLNSTNMTLNPQELRNAEFEGLFINTAAELSGNEFWKKHSIFNVQDIRRMNDIQFISSILMYFRLGISEDTTQENYNKVYDLYNTEYDEKAEDVQLFNQIIAETDKIINNNKEVAKFIRRKTHLYSLFLMIYFFIKKQGGIEQNQIDQYKNFVDAYNDSKKLKELFSPSIQKIINEYKKLSSTGTQGKSNRMRRNDILKKILS